MNDDTLVVGNGCVLDIVNSLEILRHMVRSVVVEHVDESLASVTFVVEKAFVDHLVDVATAAVYAAGTELDVDDEECEEEDFVLEGELNGPVPKRIIH